MKVVVNSLAVEYSDQGRGKVILLLHGWRSNHQAFKGLAVNMARQYRVLAVDLPGFGGSEAPSGVWGIDEYASFLEAFLAKLGCKDLYAVVGHSMSAGIAIKAVAQRQLQPGKLVLIGAAGVRKPKSFRNQVLKLVAKGGKLGLRLLPAAHRAALRRRFYKKIGSDYGEAGNLRETFVKIVGEDVRAYAKELKLPVLLLYGKDDTETPVSYGRLFQPLIAGSRLEVIAGGGHYIFLDQPQATQQTIMEFLK